MDGNGWTRFWGSWMPAAVLLAFSVGWTGFMLMRPRAGEPVAAFFPINTPPNVAFGGVVNAGAETIQSVGATPAVVLARASDPGFIDKLYANGALLVVRAPSAGECRG